MGRVGETRLIHSLVDDFAKRVLVVDPERWSEGELVGSRAAAGVKELKLGVGTELLEQLCVLRQREVDAAAVLDEPRHPFGLRVRGRGLLRPQLPDVSDLLEAISNLRERLGFVSLRLLGKDKSTQVAPPLFAAQGPPHTAQRPPVDREDLGWRI